MPSLRNSEMALSSPMLTALKKSWKKLLSMPVRTSPRTSPVRLLILRAR
jgi:hypothetical protein